MARCEVCGQQAEDLQPHGCDGSVVMACSRCLARESSHHYITRRQWVETSMMHHENGDVPMPPIPSTSRLQYEHRRGGRRRRSNR